MYTSHDAGSVKNMTESAIVGGESSSSRLTRPYMFSEFFAGFGSFTTAVSSLDEALVKTTVAHDGYQDTQRHCRASGQPSSMALLLGYQ